MRFISYAPNFEDILLYRALRHIERGRYVDIGAGDPDASVTRAFYERGWHGVNVEGARALHRKFLVARPADVNLQVVAGGADLPETEFYEAEGTLASSVDEARARATGAPLVRRYLPQRSVAAICAELGEGPIHFLRIGVENIEPDLARLRPWIVVLAGRQDGRLDAAGYDAAWHDGLNTFYVAREHAELAPALALPPSSRDDFHLREDHPYAYPLDDWRALTARLRSEAEAAEVRAEEARNWAEARVTERSEQFDQREAAYQARETAYIADFEARDAAALARLETLQRELADAVARTQAERARADHTEKVLGERVDSLHASLHAILHSTSWRVTAPLRSWSLRLQQLRARLRHVWWRIRHAIAQLRQALRAAPRALVKRAVRAVVARPRLFAFVRHHVGRHPRLVGWLRTTMHRSTAPAAAAVPLPVHAEQLSAPARDALADLQRAFERSR
jgi:hypothetical protein